MPASPSRSSWWTRVAEDFLGDRLDDLERIVSPLVDADLLPLLHPRLAARHRDLLVHLETLAWDDPGAADTVFDILASAIPASDHDGDVPVTIVLAGIESPSVASSFARRWWHRLAIAHVDDTPRSGIAFTTTAYAVAACEGLLLVEGQRHERDVFIWLQTAARHIEVDYGGGVDLVLVLRAARLLQPVLARAVAAGGRG